MALDPPARLPVVVDVLGLFADRLSLDEESGFQANGGKDYRQDDDDHRAISIPLAIFRVARQRVTLRGVTPIRLAAWLAERLSPPMKG
jgi:hypothetical protein